MKIATLLKSSTVLSMVALLALSACGGGGGEGPMTGGGQMVPEDVDLSSVTAGYMAGAGTVQMAAGQSVVHGDVEFTCAAGDADCAVTVEVGADGTVTATSAGGMVTAMNSAAYNTRITPMAVDLAPVTAGFMAQAGTVTITAGQSAIHGDVEFTCAAGGDDCGVTVEVGADGTVSATSTGGMVTAMNSDAYTTRITPMAVDLAPVTAGFMAGARTVQVAAGQSVVHGDVEFTCAAGDADCAVTVEVGADGTVTATSTGGMVTAMNSAAYNTRITPMAVDLAPVTAGFMAQAGTVTITAGQSAIHGDVEFTCAAGDADCAVTVEVDADGTVTTTSTGGMVTAMNSDAYTTRITPMAVDLAPVTAGFMAGAGTVQVAAGQSVVHGDVAFTCAAGGTDCEVVVMVDANGGISATSTGGMVTAMNSDAYTTRITPMAVDLAPVTAGFMAGTGTVQVAAGQSVVHGDVEFTCAAGSADCEVVVMVDANGGISATSTGGMVTAMNAPGYPIMDADFSHVTEWRNNPTAEDLLDHWNDADALKSTLGLSMVSQADIDSRKTLIRNLINSAGSDPATSGTVLRDVDPDDIEIIGERDGITYGQWKGGPAGTLNIKFDWRFAENVGAATRARMERAGKSWSHRIMEKNRDREAPSGTTFVHEAGAFSPVRVERTLDENVSTSGVLIFVLDQGSNSGDYSSAYWYDPNYRPDVLDPWLASLLLSRRHHGYSYTMAHEIGHTLGIFPNLGAYTAYDNLVDRADYTFEGPQAVRANGGDPVPFQWWTSDLQPAVPDTPGATVDYTHPGDCDSIMSYCSADTLERPGELDFAFLADLGYDILDASTASEPELYGYGAWGQYSAWGAGVERVLEYVDDGSEVFARDQLRAGADAFGIAPSMTLAELHAAESLGSATWTGSLIGVDLGSTHLPPVFGDAELAVDLTTLDGSAQFENLTVHDDGEAIGFRSPDLMYDIGVTGNSFSDADGYIAGSFFGPAHQEMAGILDDQTQGVELLAGFGGTR